MSAPVDAQTVTSFPVRDLRPAEVRSDAGTGPLALLGSRCPSCGELSFPARATCGRCFSAPLEVIPLGSSGRLYAFSTVHVSSSRPVPYTLGFVDLPCGVRVLTPLFGPAGEFRIDDEVIVTAGDGSGWGFRKTN
jgi:uncharacterized protein